METSSTLVALASGGGRAGVAVIRLSGRGAVAALEKMCRPSLLPPPRKAVLRDIVDYRDGTPIDRALVLRFEAPASFTGEDVVEFHVHGGAAVIGDMIEALCSLDGIEPAGPGAFSRRAFENGKLDLTEAEGLADLVDAETTAQRRQALRQMDGALGRLYAGWAESLTRLLAFTEAEIDFADEEAIPDEITSGRQEEFARVAAEIDAHLNDNRRGEKVREGFFIALLGAPNAGKSSLLNALSKRDAAIVSSTPGTTRDVIEVRLDLGGWPVTLADTAGLRAAEEEIESEGVRRALARARAADLKILLFDGTGTPDKETLALFDDDALLVVNKTDAMDPAALETAKEGFFAFDKGRGTDDRILFLSAKTGEGLSSFSARLVQEIEKRFATTEAPALTRERHRLALAECREHLVRARGATQTELAAEDLRLAVRALGRITGRVDVENLLDIIFSSFCVGK